MAARLTKRKLEHNLVKRNLGQKLTVIEDADIFSFVEHRTVAQEIVSSSPAGPTLSLNN